MNPHISARFMEKKLDLTLPSKISMETNLFETPYPTVPTKVGEKRAVLWVFGSFSGCNSYTKSITSLGTSTAWHVIIQSGM